MNPYSVLPLVSGSVIAFLGLLTYSNNSRSPLHRRFLWLCVSCCVWPLSLGIFLNQTNPAVVLVLAKIGHLTGTFGPAACLDLIAWFAARDRFRWVCRGYYLVASVIWSLAMLTDWYFSGQIKWFGWGPYPMPGPLMHIDAALGVAAAIVSYSLLFGMYKRQRKQIEPEQLNKVHYLFAALAVLILALVDYLPKYGVQIMPIGSVFLAAFAALISYAIIRHRLMDIRVVIRRTVVYSLLGAVITGAYFGVVVLAEKSLQGFIGYRSMVGSLLAGIAIAVGFNPVRELIQRAIDRLVFRTDRMAMLQENERLRLELTHAERLRSVATLAAGMAHEIKNPLAAIKTFAEYLPEKYDDQGFREKFSRIVAQEADKMNALVHRLLDFAKPQAPKRQPVHLSRLLEETLDLLQNGLVKKQVQIIRAFGSDDEALVDPGQIRQVFLNVLLNSIEAIEPPGHISVSVVRVNGHIDVLLADSGRGIPRKDLTHVFDPFYTTKATGTGLGLSVVHTIVREHGGRISLDSVAGHGTTVRVQLPAHEPAGDRGRTAAAGCTG